MATFIDRLDAGERLADKLNKYKNAAGIVLAIPRGGVPVGYVVARNLGLPLDLLLTKKIGHPSNKEYAIGAVSLTDRYVVPHADVSQAYIEEETERVRARLLEMQQKFREGRPLTALKGQILIIVDDGIATGNTLMAAIGMLRRQEPARIVVAVPVAPSDSIQRLKDVADEVVCLHIPGNFYGVGAFYDNFDQVSDETVLEYIDSYQHEFGGK
ncbi:MAG TPA: phosphoribosyltransferase [Saprospirales bacterium]|nr:phosphoribosyltransferase [Saprospirales bacterium]